MKKGFFTLLFVFSLTAAFAQTTPADEVAGVRQACFNYIDTFYKADTTLAYASIHPTLQKRGFFFDEKTGRYSKQLEMPFPALIRLAKTWNKDGKRANAGSPRTVEVFEVADKTAMAKVTAVWGIDYLHLIRENGNWMIVNVLWQSPPKSLQALK
ncbi:nuclear transport factor 2 family protein [Larkinella sp. VNQ87]|uniref:nuclear transport factor 2 family protein n=1 Tax=Larkinella sp. VNQ87 TaxID=3400921 RepID=UPI003C118601